MPDYLKFLEDQEAQRQQGLSSGIAAASTLTQGVNPDEAARARQTAGFLGVPTAAVEALPAESAQQARVRKIDQDTQTAPTLRQNYTDADWHKIASDDSGVLANVENVVRKLGSAAVDVGKYAVSAPGAPGGGLMGDLGALASGIPSAGGGLYGAAAAPFELLGLNTVGGFLRDQAEQAGYVRDRWAQPLGANPDILQRGFASGLQSAGQNLVMLPLGLATGGQGMMLGGMGGVTFGQTYTKARDAGLAPVRAVPYAAEDAAAEVITEKFLGASGFLQQVKAGASAGKLFMYELLKEVPGEMAATVWQNFNEWTNLNPDKSVGQFIAEQPEQLAETVIATLVGGTAQIGGVKAAEAAGARLSSEDAKVARADEVAQLLEQFAKLMEASKLRGRDAGEFNRFIAQIAEENGEAPTELYVDAQQLANTLNQSAVTMEHLRAMAPAVADQLEASQNVPGADIRIPVAELAAAGPDITTALLDHLRESPDAMSRAEAQTFMTEQGDRIKAEVEKTLAQKQEQDAFRQQVQDTRAQFEQQLNAAGKFRPEVNTAYATLLANFYATQALRSGVPLAEFLQRYRLNVTSQEPGSVAAGVQQLNQGGLQALRDQWKASGIDASVSESNGVITLSKIVVPESERGAGKGTAAMQALIDYADATGQHVALTPAADFGGNKKRLVKFYKRFGFVENKGKSRAFTVSESMYRQAKGKTLYQSAAGLSPDEATHAVQVLEKAGLGNLQMVDSLDQLPETAQQKIRSQGAAGTRGIYDPATDTTYLVRSNLASLDEAFFVGLHEAFHRGLRKTVGPEVEPVLTLIHDGNERVRELTSRYMEQGLPQTEAIEEVLADMAGQGEAGSLKGWDQLLKLLKDAITRMAQAVGIKVNVTDQMVTDIVAGMRRAGMQDAVNNVLHQSANQQQGPQVEVTQDADGMPVIRTPDIELGFARPFEVMDFIPTADNQQMLNMAITSPAGEYLGWTNVLFVDGAPVALYDIDIEGDKRGQQAGTKAVEALLEATPGGELAISNIIPSARGFWEKLGVGVQNVEDTAAYDGTITRESFAASPAGAQRRAARAADQGSQGAGGSGQADAAGRLNQGERGSLSFGQDITASPAVLALLENADLSTFIHESGHFFLEVQADMAARVEAMGPLANEQDRAIVEDFTKILDWFGIKGSPTQTPLQQWEQMSLEEKREHHEQWARGFERFVMEGNAPSLELTNLFARFRSWLVSVYKTLTSLNVSLTDDVRTVMGRMLASDQAIAEAQDARALGPMFRTQEQAGMTPEEYADYQATAERATANASAELDARLLKDMRWLSRARDKALKARQAEVDGLRKEIEREVRSQVMATSVYRAWVFLTARAPKAHDQTATIERAKEIADWKAKRAEQEAAVRKAERDKLYAANPEVTGLQKGQLAAKNKKQIDINVQQQMLDWEKANPAPKAIPAATEDLGPEFAVGKLNTEAVKKLNKAAAATLAERRMTSATGMDPDIVAEQFDFQSGQQLVSALSRAPAPEQVIAEMTDEQMLQQHGDIASPQALQRAADEAVHNELRARVIAQELKALAKANKVTATGDSLVSRSTVDVMAKAAQDYAAKVIARQKVKDLRPAQYAAAEARSAKLAEQSLGKSTQEAAMHKRNQLVNNYATKAAYDALKEINAARDFFRKVLTGAQDKVSKTRDFDVVQAARAILADYGVGTRGEAAQKYLEAVERSDPGMYKVLRDKVDNLTVNARPLNELTVEEFRGLVEEIEGLWHLAKRSRQMEVGGKLIDIEAAKLPLVDRMEAIGIPEHMPGEKHAVTEAERRLSRLRSFGAALRRMESWVEAKDGAAMGAFRQFVWQPVKEAADRYRADKGKFLKRYRDLLASVQFPVARIDAPELGYTFGYSRGGSGKAEILHALLHTGNASNKRKMLLGRQWGQTLETGELDTRKWDAFVNRMIREGVLTRQDFAFAQGVWDLLEEMKPLAQKAHRDVFGRYFDEITAESFTIQFPDGAESFRGGYVPAVMDPEVVKDAATRALQEDENTTLAYAFPSTPKGFTKARVEINRPLLLDLRYLGQHIDKVLLFSHLEQPIRDVRKVLTSREVSEPLHRIDPSAYDGLLTPWMNRAARQTVETKVPGDNNLMRFFSKARSRAGMAAMFANVANAAQQITGLSIAAVKVRPGLLAHAMVQWAKAPRQVSSAVAEASAYMASRMDDEVSQMNAAIDDILLNPSVYEKAQAWTAKHAYFLQAAVDNVVGPVVWTGAYNQALEQGHDEKDAVRIADSTVRQTQGSTLPEDVARFETGNAFVRMFTQFSGYFGMQANLLGTEFANIMHEQGLRKGMGRGLYVFTLGFLVPAMVSELIVQAFKGGPDDEDKDGSTLDDWLMAVLVMANVRSGLAMLPGVGQTANMAINTFNSKPYDDRISTAPAISMIESAVKAPHSVYKAVMDDGNRRTAVRDLATLISMTTGLPAAAVARPLGYLAGMSEDKIAPTGPADAARGMVTGLPSPESKR